MARVAEHEAGTVTEVTAAAGTHRRRRTTLLLAALAAVLSLGLVVAAVTGVVFRGGGHAAAPDPLPTLSDVAPPLAATSTAAASQAALAALVADALAVPLADPALGPVGAVVIDVGSGSLVYDRQGAVPRVPASTVKVLTAATAMHVLGGDARFRTVVVSGSVPGEIVLVGGGDVTLARTAPGDLYPGAATVAELASAVRSHLPGGAPPVRVLVDSSRYTGPGVAPGVPPSWTDSSLPPVVPVMVDGGRVAPDEPARAAEADLDAGRALAAALGNPAAEVVRGAAPPGAGELGAVTSPPVAELVRAMLLHSDNALAEALGREAALKAGLPGSFEGAAAVVTRTVTSIAAAAGGGAAATGTVLFDASGLSPDNRVPPAAVATVLLAAARGTDDGLRRVVAALPVAGYVGTLAERYRGDPAAAAAAGEVRAKTGRLPGVAALAGLVGTADGRLLVFAFADDAVPRGPVRASAALDRAAAALAACSCGALERASGGSPTSPATSDPNPYGG